MHMAHGFLPFNALSIFSLSVVEMCQVSWQPLKPPEAMAALQKVKMLVLRGLIVFAGGLLP